MCVYCRAVDECRPHSPHRLHTSPHSPNTRVLIPLHSHTPWSEYSNSPSMRPALWMSSCVWVWVCGCVGVRIHRSMVAHESTHRSSTHTRVELCWYTQEHGSISYCDLQCAMRSTTHQPHNAHKIRMTQITQCNQPRNAHKITQPHYAHAITQCSPPLTSRSPAAKGRATSICGCGGMMPSEVCWSTGKVRRVHRCMCMTACVCESVCVCARARACVFGRGPHNWLSYLLAASIYSSSSTTSQQVEHAPPPTHTRMVSK